MPFGVVAGFIGDAVAGIAAGIGAAADFVGGAIGIGAAADGVGAVVGADALAGAGVGGILDAGAAAGFGALDAAGAAGLDAGLGAAFDAFGSTALDAGASGIASGAADAAGAAVTTGAESGLSGATAATTGVEGGITNSLGATSSGIASGLGDTNAALAAEAAPTFSSVSGPAEAASGYGGIGSDAAAAARTAGSAALSPADAADLTAHLGLTGGNQVTTTAGDLAAGAGGSANSTGPLSSLTRFLGFGGDTAGGGGGGAAGLSDSATLDAASGGGSMLGKYGPLALGALSAASSMFNKPAAAAALPGPSSVALGPYFNQPLNTNVPGRTAVNPFPAQAPATSSQAPTQAPANQPPPQAPAATTSNTGLPPGEAPNSYWTYGAPQPNYFNNNGLPSMGWPGGVPPSSMPMSQMTSAPNPGVPLLAHGGALGRAHDQEFRTGSGNHRVAGPGTETSDSIPAMLSNHEYVLDAEDMSLIGGGDPVRGADRLDRDRRELARGRGVLSRFKSEGARA